MAATDAKWDVKVMESKEKPWAEKNSTEKGMTVVIYTLKVACIILLLYMFILSLGLMGNAFKILGGKTAGATFRNQEIFNNPFAGLVIGILATVLVQSSSTSTSIIITMTAAGLMKVDNAIYMIMGANIGTSVTNTIVSLTQIGNKDEYRRAFAGATVHDCFNFLTVMILLPLEAATNVLRIMATALVDAMLEPDQDKAQKQDFLKLVTKPVSSRLIQVDKKLVTKVAEASDQATLDKLMKASMIVQKRTKDTHLFMDTPMSDDAAGWLLLFASLALLTVCLSLLVKMLQSVFRGRAAIWMQMLLNLEFKSAPRLGDYVLMLFGIGITILMQSSSITTSTLTPLVGIGLIKLDKMFPFTVGANIGTCVTGILSALASSNIPVGMTVAFAHLEFNLIGTIIWFPLLTLRAIPLNMAKFLGNLAADLTWFPLAYIITMFVLFPLLLLGFSLGGTAVFSTLATLFFLCIFALIVVLWLRATRRQKLPAMLQRDPAWMPKSLRAEPADGSEQQDDAIAEQGAASADMGADTIWLQAPFVWGIAWIALIMLVLACPNGQWADAKYYNFDAREHVGIGAWSACSASFEEAMPYSSKPSCTALEASTCWNAKMSSCSESGFADKDEANDLYEASWAYCATEKGCSPSDWEKACTSASCSGASHSLQCANVTKAVVGGEKQLVYKTGTAWEAGDRCRPLGDMCENAASIGHAGGLSIAGLVFAFLGQFSVVAYQVMRKNRDMTKVLSASAAFFALAILLLMAGWAQFASVLDSVTSCIVVDATTGKAVVAEGRFEAILDSNGSIGYGLIVGAWVLLVFVEALIVQRVMYERNKAGKASEAKAEDPGEAI